MAASLYTVTFVSLAGETIVSRHFSTLRAARKHAAWLASRPFAAAVKTYRGQAGECLVEAA